MASGEGLNPILDNRAIHQQFEGAGEIANDISKQNREAEQAAAIIRDPDIKELAIDTIAAEQQATVNVLRQISDDLPYEALGTHYTETLSQLGEKAVALARAERGVDELEASLNGDIEVVAWLRPQLREKAELLAEASADSFAQEQGIGEIREDIDRLQAQKLAYEEILRAAGRAWPIPTAISAESAEAPAEGVIVSEVKPKDKPIDTSAEDLKLISQERRGQRSIGPHEVYDSQASQHLASYFVDHPNQIFSAEELAGFLYRTDVSSASQSEARVLRSRVTTILGPKRQGREDTVSVEQLLGEEKMTLQYGKLREKRVLKRVYRALPTADFSEEHLSPTDTDGGAVRWQISDEQKSLLEDNKEAKTQSGPEESLGQDGGETASSDRRGKTVEKLLEVFSGSLGEAMTYEELARRVYPDSDKATDVLVHRVQVTMTASKFLKRKLDDAGIEIMREKVQSEAPSGRKITLTTLTAQKKTDGISQAASHQQTAVEAEEAPIAEPETSAGPVKPDINDPAQDQPISSGLEVRQPTPNWELPFRQRVRECLARFETAGGIPEDGDIHRSFIPVSSEAVLEMLFDKEIITREQLQQRSISIRGGVGAMLLRTNGTKQLFSSAGKRKKALAILDDELTQLVPKRTAIATS